MCGIVGSFNTPDLGSWATTQVEKLKRRGPDSQIIKEFDKNLFMGVTRLAMTDPHPRSNQPMLDSRSGNAISFNGEIYNYREIRELLKKYGVSFDTESDTEVLLKYIGIFGFSSINLLNGMYAFSFYDKKLQKLFLTRDYLGKKPLYFLVEGNSIKWSSSLESFQNESNKENLTNSSLIEFLSLGYLLDPETCSPKVLAVRPGETIQFDLKLNTFSALSISNFTSDLTSSDEGIRILINNSVKNRTSEHSKLALSLSGGVDSTVMAVELAKLNNSDVMAFSARWPDSDKERYNYDANQAVKTANILGLDMTIVDMPTSSEIKSQLQLYLSAMQEPNNNPTGLSMMRLFETISQMGFRLLLTGDGSDEIFGGYRRHLLSQKYPNLLKATLSTHKNFHFTDYRRNSNLIPKLLSTQISPKSPLFWLHWHWIFSPPELMRILNFNYNSDIILEILTKSINLISPQDTSVLSAESIMDRDQKIWLAMESNRRLDRTSMYYSIEARSPFQDKNVIEWAYTYMRRTRFSNLDKKILWKAYPELIKLGIEKNKLGFTSPVGHWLRTNPTLIRQSLEFLSLDSRFNAKELMYYLGAPQRGNYRELMQLWSLVVLANWMAKI
jgi:asparagine synthase (glutamine-hydrolysing)